MSEVAAADDEALAAAPFAARDEALAAAPFAEDDAALTAALFAVDPSGLGGVALRARAGPARDRWMAALTALLPAGTPLGRAPAGIGDDRLLGGLDLAASLSAGRPVVERGVLAAHDGGVVVLPMAERLEDGMASRLCAVMDCGEVLLARDGLSARLPARVGLVLLDEGAEPEERPPSALMDRLAFRLELDARAGDAAAADAAGVIAARARLAVMGSTPDEIVEALCAAATAFGIDAMRPALLAVRAARAHAALRGRDDAAVEDAAAAVRLVLAPRALALPAEPEAEVEASEPSPSDDAAPEREDGGEGQAAEQLVAAAQAALPAEMLARAVADNVRAIRAPRRSGSGEAAKSARRGRPTGSRPGRLRPGDRLDLAATLRAALPWRRLRGGAVDAPVPVRVDDFRIRRFVQGRETTSIFVVDASGSAALQRLAEAKGAVELLLARAYVSRDRVALIAFRGGGAQVLLPSTRSLTRAKRSLADLPGGGGTPLAAGLDAALALALAERARDRTPRLVVLTDGRANVGRDGEGGRAGAERDALAVALRIGEARITTAFLDTAPRPQADADRFARAMRATYAPLPYADAARVSALAQALA